MDLFLILVVSLLAIVITFVCALLFYGGMKIIDMFKGFKQELHTLNVNMSGIVTANNKDHDSIKEKLSNHDNEFIKVHGRIDKHLIKDHNKDIE
jgi:hypothetical protein